MEISVADLRALQEQGCRIYDIRDLGEQEFGTIPGSMPITGRELTQAPPADLQVPVVIICARGVFSVVVADALCKMGYRAYSLKGGYAAWLCAEVAAQDTCAMCERVEQSLRTRYKSPLLSRFVRAIKQYRLIQNGDRIAVCISGGKDSMLMAKLFQELKRHSQWDFEVQYLVMDPGYSESNRRMIEMNAHNLGIPVTIFESDIFESVYTIEKSPCYLCARMRRGHLYSYARSLGCNKIALGHHYDDVIETILMGMLYGSQIQTMMPKLHSTNFTGMELIRPMYLIREADIKSWRDANNLHFLQCACKFTEACTTCNDGRSRSKRQEIKELIQELKKTNPGVENAIFRSVENVCLDTVIAYKQKGCVHHFLDTYEVGNAFEEADAKGVEL